MLNDSMGLIELAFFLQRKYIKDEIFIAFEFWFLQFQEVIPVEADLDLVAKLFSFSDEVYIFLCCLDF